MHRNGDVHILMDGAGDAEGAGLIEGDVGVEAGVVAERFHALRDPGVIGIGLLGADEWAG